MIIIRVDGNEKIGLGHVMRCLSVADALKSNGNNLMFVTADEKCRELLSQRGFSCTVLHTDYSDMDGEWDHLSELLDSIQPSAVLVDSYYVTDSYLRNLRKKVRLIYMDDQLSFPYPSDMLINYNIFAKRGDYERLYRDAQIVPELILGTEYTPLRKEFSQVTPNVQPEFARRVLISTGGADPRHIALELIRCIREDAQRFHDYLFTFVVGAANADLKAIRELSADTEQIRIVCNVQNMSQLMLENDIAVSAAGSTLYELCACGIPTITYVLADNQIPAAEVFGESGVMINAGDVRTTENFARRLFDSVIRLSQDRPQRIMMAQSSHRVTDGHGAYRLAEVISR